MTPFGNRKAHRATNDEVLTRIPEALKSQGFGVLTGV